MRRTPLLLALCSLLSPSLGLADQAPAKAASAYGHKHQLVVSGASRMALGGAHFAHRIPLSVLPKDRFEMAISPSVALFVAHHFALGLAGDLEVARANGQTAWGLAVGPQALGLVPLSERVALMPSLAAFYTHARNDERVALAIRLQALFHLSPGLSLAVGPQVAQDLWRQGARLRITDYNLVVSLVGWI